MPLGKEDFEFRDLQTGPVVEPHERLACDAVLTANKKYRVQTRENQPENLTYIRHVCLFNLGFRLSYMEKFPVLFQGLQTGPDVEPHERLACDAVLTANKRYLVQG